MAFRGNPDFAKEIAQKREADKKAQQSMDHETRLTKGATRNFESMYEEGKIIENIKRAPLLKGLTSDSLSSPSVHILTGLGTTLSLRH